jgi:hypothetical protein
MTCCGLRFAGGVTGGESRPAEGRKSLMRAALGLARVPSTTRDGRPGAIQRSGGKRREGGLLLPVSPPDSPELRPGRFTLNP